MNGAPFRHEAYVASMLRLWQAGNSGGRPVWRASLENPHTGERLAFGDAKDLLTFLAHLMADLADGIAPLEKVDPWYGGPSGCDAHELLPAPEAPLDGLTVSQFLQDGSQERR